MSEFKQDDTLDVRGAVENREKELHHGDFVTGEDGVAGIVIDEAEDVQRKQSETKQAKSIASVMVAQNKQILQLKNNEIVDGLGVSAEAIERERQNIAQLEKNGDPQSMEHLEAIRKLSAEAEKWEPSMNGIAPAGSPAAEDFKQILRPTENGGIDVTGIDTNALKENAIDEYNKQQFEQDRQNQNEAQQTPVEHNVLPGEASADQVTFNVPEGQVHSFITTLPKSTRENISRSKSIVVNEVKKKIVPSAIRSITSISEFKHVVKSKNDSEVVSVVLPNSGIYATFKGCGSLAMASIAPDPNNQTDYAKRYQFCYDNLVTTSLGKLSYTEFCAYVALVDLDLCIFTILRASDPDDSKITLICGEETCKTEYDVAFKYSTLMDMDSVSQETLAQVGEIVKNKDIYENAKAVFQNSPVMTVKTIEITMPDNSVVDVEIKITNGTTMIERTPIIPEIVEQKNQYIAALLMFIPRVYYTPVQEGSDEPITYEVTDAKVIAEILSELDDESLTVISSILKDLKQFDSPTFSFKGDFECPSCHRHESKISCSVDTLVFQKVSRVM